MKNYTLLLLFSCLGVASLVAQKGEPNELIQQFFEVYDQGKPDDAIELLYSTNNKEWLAQIRENIDNVKAKFRDLPQIVGKYYGYEKLSEDQLGSCFRTIIYLVKYDRQPIRFTFQYYKPNDNWRLYGFSYDDDLLDDHEEMIKKKLVE